MEETQQDTQPASTTRDMLNHALNDNPTQMDRVMNDLLMTKVVAAIQDKKVEVARSMFDDQVDETDETDEADEDQEVDDSEQQQDEDSNEDT